jgi:hypothetical protein
MRKCWICHRTEEELINDCNKLKFDGGMFIDGKKEVFFVKEMDVNTCQVCRNIIYSLSIEIAEEKFTELIDDLKIESHVRKG